MICIQCEMRTKANRSRLNINGAVTMCDSAKLSNHVTTGSFTTVEYSWLKKQGRHLREKSSHKSS